MTETGGQSELQRSEEVQPLYRHRILAVDDEPGIPRMLGDMVPMVVDVEQFDTASNGAEALRLFDEGSYNTILTDWNMPTMDGIELARELQKKAQERQIKLQIAMITGGEGGRSLPSPEELAESGITHVLPKPFRIGQLQELFNAMNDDRVAGK